MTPRAAAIVARRKKRAAEVRDRHFKKLEDDHRAYLATKERPQIPQPADEKAAHDLFSMLNNGSAQERQIAQQIIKQMPDDIRAAVMEKADPDSPFKKRRSRQRNGF
jgi:hypothetical protein